MRILVTRGPVVESEHRVDAVVVGRDGTILADGDPQRAVIPRSAIKFVQAVPLLRSGAADRFDVTEEEVVLACSSHSGEPAHVAAVAAWLDRLGFGPADLACGPDLPMSAAAAAELHRIGEGPAVLYNCCSGKHAGFLTVIRHLALDPAGYVEPEHPLQRLVTEAIEEFTGHRLADQTPGRDGCAIPTFAVPLVGLAGAMQRLVDPVGLDPATASAAARLVAAPQGRQFWIAGTGRHEVTLGDAIAEPLVVKTGAEGVFVAGLPDRGLGIAVKVADGATRAAEVAISAVLARLGILDQGAVSRAVTNTSGDVVGRIEPAVA
ncbi:MAG: asparaginase [Actinomycetota bacterium]